MKQKLLINKALIGLAVLSFFLGIWSGLVNMFEAKTEGISKSKSNPFVVEMYSSIPTSFDTANIGSAAQYNIIHHLVRTPIRYTKDYLIEGDLLESWTIDPDHKTYHLKLKQAQRFSNGEEITAEDLIRSMDRLRNYKTAIHFDFSEIREIKAESKFEVVLKLANPNSNFIKQMAHPEFGVLYKPQMSVDINSYSISSGPYFIESSGPAELKFKKNPYFSSKINYPESLLWRSSTMEKQIQGLVSGEVDASLPNQSFGLTEHKQVTASKDLQVVDTHLGYSFFLSLNPKSELFNSESNRRAFLSFLNAAKIKVGHMSPLWEAADQLYLPGGFGRPKQEEIQRIWDEISKVKPHKLFEGKEIHLLFSKSFIFEKEIVTALSHLFAVKVSYYQNFDDYAQLISKNSFDLVQVNNDFSSADLVENLLVTFKQSRPLILLPLDHKIHKILKTLSTEVDPAKRQEGIQSIGKLLLEEGFIFPVAFNRKFVYAKKGIIFSGWSKVFPDVRFWKVCKDDCH